MRRYEPKPWDIRRCDMVHADEGEYVLYSDAKAEIERLTAERNESAMLLSLSMKRAEKAEAERDGLLEHCKLEEARGDKLKTEHDEVLVKVGGEIDRRDHLVNGPARLWMHEGSSAPWFVKPAGNSTEYVRADLSPAPDAVERLVEAARAGLNYLESTEGEFGITLGSATGLRAALAAMEASHDHT